MILRRLSSAILLFAAALNVCAESAPETRMNARFHRAVQSIDARFARLRNERLSDPAFRAEAGRAHDAVTAFLSSHPDGGPARYDKWKTHARLLDVRMDSLRDAPRTDRVRHLSRARLLFGALVCEAVVDRAKRETLPVLLLLSTSVSCACTLEKCAEQERVLGTVERRLRGRAVVLMADAFHRYDLQQRFDAYFQPTLLVLGSDGREIRRFENAVAQEEDLLHALATTRTNHGT